MFCEFCGSGSECVVCGRGQSQMGRKASKAANARSDRRVRFMLGCTIFTNTEPELIRGAVIIRGDYRYAKSIQGLITRHLDWDNLRVWLPRK